MRNAARYDIPKPGQIGTDIQCEPMHRHPPAAANPDRANLSLPALYTRIDPNPRLARRAVPQNPIIREYPDRYLLQFTKIAADISIEFLEVEYRVSDQLPWAVEGNVPAAIGSKKLHPFLPHPVVSDQHILNTSALSQRIYRRMFDKQ